MVGFDNLVDKQIFGTFPSCNLLTIQMEYLDNGNIPQINRFDRLLNETAVCGLKKYTIHIE